MSEIDKSLHLYLSIMTYLPIMEEIAELRKNTDISQRERASCQVIPFYLRDGIRRRTSWQFPSHFCHRLMATAQPGMSTWFHKGAGGCGFFLQPSNSTPDLIHLFNWSKSLDSWLVKQCLPDWLQQIPFVEYFGHPWAELSGSPLHILSVLHHSKNRSRVTYWFIVCANVEFSWEISFTFSRYPSHSLTSLLRASLFLLMAESCLSSSGTR